MKHLKKIKFYFVLFAIVVGFGKITAQDITVSPKVCYFSGNEVVKLNITSKNVAFSTNNSDCPSKLLVTSSNVVFQQSSPLLYQKPISVTKNNIEVEITPGTLYFEGFYNLTVGAGEPCAYQCNNCVEFKRRKVFTTNMSNTNDRYTIKALLTASGYTFAANQTVVTDTNLLIQKENIQITSANTLAISDIRLNRISKDSIMIEATSEYQLWRGAYSIIINNLPAMQPYLGLFLEAPQVKATIAQPYNGVRSKFTISVAGMKFSKTDTSNCNTKLNVQASDIVFTSATSTISMPIEVSDVVIQDSIISGYVMLPSNIGNTTATLLNRQGCNIAASDPIAITPIAQIYYTPKLQIDNPTAGVKSRFSIAVPNVKFINTGAGNCVTKLKVTASDVVFFSATGYFNFESDISNIIVGDSIITGDILMNEKMYSVYARVNNSDGCNGYISNQIAVLPAVAVAPKLYTVATAEAGRGNVMNIKANVASNLYFTNTGVSDCSLNGKPYIYAASINPKDLEITNGAVSYLVDSASFYPVNDYRKSTISIAWKVPENAPLGNYKLVLRKGVSCNFESVETVAVVCRDSAYENLDIIGLKEVCKNTHQTFRIKKFNDTQYTWKVYIGNFLIDIHGVLNSSLEKEVAGDSVSVYFNQNKTIVLTAENSCGKVLSKQIAPNIDEPVDETKPYQIAGEDSSVVNGIKAYLPYTSEQLNNYNPSSEKYARVKYNWQWKVLSGGVLIDSIPQDSLMKNMAIVKWTQAGAHLLSATPYNTCSTGKPHLYSVVVGSKNSKPIIYTDAALKFEYSDQKTLKVFSSTVGGVHEWNLTLLNNYSSNWGDTSKLKTINKTWRTTINIGGIADFYAKLSEKISVLGSVPRISDAVLLWANPRITSTENKTISDQSQATVDCYPNPASQLLTISLNNWGSTPLNISIVNQLGKEVYGLTNATPVNQIVVDALDNGIYLLKISNGKQVKFEKIAIQK